MQRSKSLAMMFLLGTLVVGGALGFSADRLITKPGVCPAPADRKGWRDRFANELELTPAQRVTLDSILDKRHRDWAAVQATVRPRIDSLQASIRPQVDSLQASIRPQLDSLRKRARVDMAKMLNPDQLRRFQQIVHEADARQAREETKRR